MSFPRLALEISRGLWFMESGAVQALTPIAEQFLLGKSIDMGMTPLSVREKTKYQANNYLVSEDGVQYSEWEAASPWYGVPDDKKYVLYMPIQTPITKYGQCGADGNAERISLLKAAESSDMISGVVFCIDSPGGTVEGTQELAAAIASFSKPKLAFVDSMAASAAYWIASSCDEILMSSDTARLGSIGAMATIMDMTGVVEKAGGKVLTLYATKSTRKGEQYREWKDEGKTKLFQAELDQWCDRFHAGIKTNRPDLNPEVYAGAVYYAEEALSMGLADGYSTLEEAFQKVFQTNTNTTMKIFGKEVAGASATATAVSVPIDAHKESEERYAAAVNAHQSVLEAFGEQAKVEGFDPAAAITAMQEASEKTQAELKTATEALAASEKSLSESQAKVTELEAKVANKPAVSTSTIKNGKDDFNAGDDPNAEFLTEEDKEARELYNSLNS